MVRGLIIRQTFVVLNLVLFGLILLTAAIVVVQLFQSPKRVSAEGPDAVARDGGGETLIVALRARKDYDSITGSGLFGDAGRFKPGISAEVAKVPDPGPEIEETGLDLKLWGATSLSPKSIYASASIEDASNRDGSKLFFVGDAVVENVTLEEVYPRWVIILNGQETPAELERLSMDEDKEDESAKVASRSTPDRRLRAVPSKRIELDKQQLIKELTLNYADLVTKVKPELYRDASGKVTGITAQNISEIPLAKTLGLKDGDVLQTLNNEKIDSQEKILEMVQKYQNASSFRIGILRNGKQTPFTFVLK